MSHRKFFVTTFLLFATVALTAADEWQTDYAKALTDMKARAALAAE